MRSDEPLSDAFQTSALACVKKLKKTLHGARAGRADGVHESRTELRRLRTYVELMGRSVFGHRRAESLCAKLHRTEKLLARCRDTDVMTASLTPYVRARPGARKELAPLVHFLEKRRSRAQARIHRTLPRHLPRDVKRFLGSAVVRGGYLGGKEAGPALVRQFTHEEIWHQYGYVLAFENRIPGSSGIFHAFRGVCRQLRFALELFGDALPSTIPLARQLHKLQDRVGEMHDHDAALALIERAVKDKSLVETDALVAYQTFHRTERDRLERALQAEARSITEPRFQSKLARSLDV